MEVGVPGTPALKTAAIQDAFKEFKPWCGFVTIPSQRMGEIIAMELTSSMSAALFRKDVQVRFS